MPSSQSRRRSRAHARPVSLWQPLANGDQCEAAPSFSADGHRIYYEGFDGVSRDAVFSMDLNGNDRRFVSDCQGTGLTDPEPSPNGTMISFTCYSPDGDGALFDANIDGSGLRQLTPFAAEVGNKSDWSPDSKRIMFISTVGEGTPPQSHVNTFTIARDGTDLRAVTNFPAGGPSPSATRTHLTASGSRSGSSRTASMRSRRSAPTAPI